MDNFPFPKLKALLLEELLNQPQGEHLTLCGGIVELAIAKKLYQGELGALPKFQYLDKLSRSDRANLEEAVREIMWQLVVQGLIVIGINTSNANWPNYKITKKGLDYIDGQEIQPYDPNGFLTDFKTKNPTFSATAYSYLEESVLAYNAGLYLSCAVMLGAASEAIVIELLQEIINSFKSSSDRLKFEKTMGTTISSKFKMIEKVLHNNIDKKVITGDLKDMINGYFSSIFHLFRRTRNEAGHPEILRSIAEDELFLNLRVFSSYVQCVEKIKVFVSTNHLIL